MISVCANSSWRARPQVFSDYRRTILPPSMMGCRGRVQRAGEVIHLIVEHVADLSPDLRIVSDLYTAFPLVPGDEAAHGGHGPDSRDPKPSCDLAICTSPTCTSTR
jgi:hypothetical protein